MMMRSVPSRVSQRDGSASDGGWVERGPGRDLAVLQVAPHKRRASATMPTRRMWKPTQVPNLWMQGGNLHQNRHYSLCLALQLKARFEKIPTPVYALAPVHHKS